MCRVSPNLIVMPASPALTPSCAARWSAQMVSLVLSTLPPPPSTSSPRDPRWETGVEGSFRAWGAAGDGG